MICPSYLVRYNCLTIACHYNVYPGKTTEPRLYVMAMKLCNNSEIQSSWFSDISVLYSHFIFLLEKSKTCYIFMRVTGPRKILTFETGPLRKDRRSPVIEYIHSQHVHSMR